MTHQRRYGPIHIQFVQHHRLAAKTDTLISALLFLRPPDPARYFQAAHDLLRHEFSEGYAQWQLATEGTADAPAGEPPAMPRPPAPSKPCKIVNIRRPPDSHQTPDAETAWTLYGSDRMDPDFQTIIENTAKFSPTFPALCNGKEFSLQNAVHYRFRLATLFLHKIGRDSRVTDNVKSSRGHYEYEKQNAEECATLPGLPNVKLINELRPSTGRSLEASDEQIVISAAELDAMVWKMCGEKQAEGYLQNWKGWSGTSGKDHPLPAGLGLKSSRDIFGPGEFCISWREVCELAETTKIYTGADLPPKFFLHLAGIVSRDNLVEYYYHRKAIPLAWMATTQSGQPPCHVGQFILALLNDPGRQQDCGFRSTRHFTQTIQQSLTELSTQVCVVGQGHFFVGNHNQIQAKPAYPVTFLSAPGIDFNAGAAARTEMSKYFLKDRFREGGREAFKARVKRTYHILFTACQDNGVTHPTALAVGLGVFMPPVEKDAVKRIYHEAQFELLSENDYGFDTYFLNPAVAMDPARQLLHEQNNSSKPYAFKCRVVLHSKDGKALASRLAHEGYRTSFLNPSDCIAVMQGCIGYWWECGLGERYVGEEDFCATSTAILMRANICPIWSAYDRGEMDKVDGRVKQVLLEGERLGATLERRIFEPVDSVDELCWQAYPREQREEENPPMVTSGNDGDDGDGDGEGEAALALPGFPYEYESRHAGIVPQAKGTMRFFRLLWVDTEANHRFHLRPMVNQLRREGIWVDVAYSTEEALEALARNRKVPINCVLTSLFVTMKRPDEGLDNAVEEIEDSGHHLLRQLHQYEGEQAFYFRTVCASTTVLKSHERSMLYSEGCNHVTFDLHRCDLQEVMEILSFVQRYSDRLCHAIAAPGLSPETKGRVVDRLLSFGIDVNFAPKAWAPLHFLAQDPQMDPKLLERVLEALPDMELGTRYATDGIPRGASPLYVAVARVNVAAVRLLLDAGALPWTQCLDPLPTPRALAQGRVKKMKAVLGTPASVIEDLLRGTQSPAGHRLSLASPPSKWHKMLTVLWISTSGQLSEHTQAIRRLIDLTPSLVVQSLACQPEGESADPLKGWIEGSLYPLMKHLGMDGLEPDEDPLAWLQCVVLELVDVAHLRRWLRLRQAIVHWVENHSSHSKSAAAGEAAAAPWLRIITYTEGFQVRHFEGEWLSAQPWLVSAAFPTAAEDLHRDHVVLNAALHPSDRIGGEALCACRSPPTPEELTQFYATVCDAVTHWAWDGDGEANDVDANPVYPDSPYNARVSHRIEAAYRSGWPSCKVSEHHTLYFRDMVQRRTNDPMKVRLVFRYPHPCWDCDAHVRAFPSLLEEITSGNCLVFIGAGFCMPAGGPSWKQLLENIAERAVKKARGSDTQRCNASTLVPAGRSPAEMEELKKDVERLVAPGADVTQFEYAAQQLEDALQGDMQSFLADCLKDVSRGWDIIHQANRIANGEKSPEHGDLLVMASRIKYVQCLKFSAVLTTNYTQELCVCQQPWTKGEPRTKGCGVCRGVAPLAAAEEEAGEEPPYLDIVRKVPGEFVPMAKRPIIQIHGSICRPQTIVLSREGYRSLLHGKPNYRDFLKSVMMSRTILYLGFSFTDDYLNEVRSDVMTMKKHSPETKNLAYAIIDNKNPQDCKYYAEHEGVRFLTWPTAQHGYGVMDRYLDSLLNMTDTCAALSGAKVVLFSPPDDRSSQGSINQNMMKLKVELERQRERTNSQVGAVMADQYQDFQLICAETLQEVERALKRNDFMQSWVVTFADTEWGSIPMIHRELIHFLWHPHARLNTTMYPTTLLVWAERKAAASLAARLNSMQDMSPRGLLVTSTVRPLSLREQYERNLHVHYCTKLSDVMARFRKVKVAGAAQYTPTSPASAGNTWRGKPPWHLHLDGGCPGAGSPSPPRPFLSRPAASDDGADCPPLVL